MKTFKIYLAGGMSNLSWEEQTLWRELVEDILHKNSDSFKFKLDIINPTSFYNFKSKQWDNQLEIMKFDLRHVKSSDLVIVNYNDPKSIATAQELIVAYEKDIPVIGITREQLHPWLECCTDKMFDDVVNAVNYAMDFYLR